MIEFKHRRPLVAQVHKALRGDIPFLHIIIGPRQVGKTTAAQQVAAAWGGETIFAAADAPCRPALNGSTPNGKTPFPVAAKGRKVLLVLDEVQKVKGWSEAVKLWDRSSAKARG